MSRASRLSDYIERQYITELGTARENVEALFADDFTYHVDGEILTKEDVVAAVIAVRASPMEGRRVEATGFEEDGDLVRWHLSATIPGMGVDQNDLHQESELRAAFNAEGKIQEVWSESSELG